MILTALAAAVIDDLALSVGVFAAIALVLYAAVALAIRFFDARYDARSGDARRKHLG